MLEGGHVCSNLGCYHSDYPDSVLFNWDIASSYTVEHLAGLIAHETYHAMGFLPGASQTEELMAYYAQYTVWGNTSQLNKYPSDLSTFSNAKVIRTTLDRINHWHEPYRSFNVFPSGYWYWLWIIDAGPTIGGR